MKRVLITGASGFIGRHSIQLLRQRGYEVHAITTGIQPRGASAEVRWHQLSLLDAAAVEAAMSAIAPTHLLHLAWFVEAGQYWLSPQNFRWLEASVAMLRVFQDCGGQRVVMAGTCAEYDWSFGYLLEGRTPCQPVHLYGVCKNALHDLAKSFCNQSGIGFAWGRIFFVYGPGEPPSKLVSSVARAILRSERAHCAQPKLIRDYLYVEDVASAFVALLDSDVQGAVNIASGMPRTLSGIARTVAMMLGAEAQLSFGDVACTDPPVLLGDNRRLAREVGWVPVFSLEEGLARTIHAIRAKLGVEADCDVTRGT